VVDVTTVANQDIWLVLAQAQLVQVLFQAPDVVLVLLVVDIVVVLHLAVALLADLVLLLATNAAVQTTLLAIARHKQ
jgi:hypothetical protein